MERPFDASRIASRLYQGGRPPIGKVLRANGFSLLVLAAEEHQPSSRNFPGVAVVHAPLDDHLCQLSQAEWNAIIGSATIAGDHIGQGGRALITCYMGLNRSGIITATTLMLLNGWSADKAIERVRTRRDGALFNESFVRQLRQLT